MFRGGGMGGGMGGGQLMDLFGSIASMPSNELLSVVVGLVLMGIIILQIRNTPPARPRAVQRSTSCLICSRDLAGERTYADRYFPNWVACGDCYDKLTPAKRRQYVAE
jgi:hypothetical protein